MHAAPARQPPSDERLWGSSCRREEIMEILRLMEAKRIIEIPVEEGDMEGVSDRAFYRQSMHLFTQPG